MFTRLPSGPSLPVILVFAATLGGCAARPADPVADYCQTLLQQMAQCRAAFETNDNAALDQCSNAADIVGAKWNDALQAVPANDPRKTALIHSYLSGMLYIVDMFTASVTGKPVDASARASQLTAVKSACSA